VAGPPPDQPYEVVKTTHRPLGVIRPPLKSLETKNKKNKTKKRFGFWGWPDHPQISRMRWSKPPQALGGNPPNPKLLFLFVLFFGLLRVAGPPPKPTGVVGHPLWTTLATP
jgi:hypothetical protein